LGGGPLSLFLFTQLSFLQSNTPAAALAQGTVHQIQHKCPKEPAMRLTGSDRSDAGLNAPPESAPRKGAQHDGKPDREPVNEFPWVLADTATLSTTNASAKVKRISTRKAASVRVEAAGAR